MYHVKGVVTRIEGNRVMVESEPDVGCVSCRSRERCIVGQEGASRNKSVWMQNDINASVGDFVVYRVEERGVVYACLLYTSPSPRDVEESRMPSSA